MKEFKMNYVYHLSNFGPKYTNFGNNGQIKRPDFRICILRPKNPFKNTWLCCCAMIKWVLEMRIFN